MKKTKTLLLSALVGLSLAMSAHSIPDYGTYTAKIIWRGGFVYVSGIGQQGCWWNATQFVFTHPNSHILAPGCTMAQNS